MENKKMDRAEKTSQIDKQPSEKLFPGVSGVPKKISLPGKLFTECSTPEEILNEIIYKVILNKLIDDLRGDLKDKSEIISEDLDTLYFPRINHGQILVYEFQNASQLFLGAYDFTQKVDIEINVAEELVGSASAIDLPLSDCFSTSSEILEVCKKASVLIDRFSSTPEEKILIHCIGGKSRSFTVMAYYLITRHLVSFLELMKLLRDGNWLISPCTPNIKFLAELLTSTATSSTSREK